MKGWTLSRSSIPQGRNENFPLGPLFVLSSQEQLRLYSLTTLEPLSYSPMMFVYQEDLQAAERSVCALFIRRIFAVTVGLLGSAC